MTYSHNQRKKMRKFPHAFTGEPTVPFILQSRWNLSKKIYKRVLDTA